MDIRDGKFIAAKDNGSFFIRNVVRWAAFPPLFNESTLCLDDNFDRLLSKSEC